MLPSANVRYQWTTVGGPHVVDGSGSFDGGGTAPRKAASYRVVVNNFMADGGDNYTVFRSCTAPLDGEVDLDAFARYLQAHSPVAPPTLAQTRPPGRLPRRRSPASRRSGTHHSRQDRWVLAVAPLGGRGRPG